MATISISIDGKTYRMACDAGQEEHLSSLAAKLDQYIGHLKNNFGEIGDHRLSVMAGIMVMDELVETQRQMIKLEQENHNLRTENSQLARAHKDSEATLAQILDKAASQVEYLAKKINNKSN